MGKLSLTLLTVVVSSSFFPLVYAANLDVDNAGATAYAGGWSASAPAFSLDGTVAGGAGFGGWGLTVDPNADLRIESVGSLGSGSSLLDTAGKSFRLSGGWYSPDGGTTWNQAYSHATRWLDPAGLDAGQAFTFEIAVRYRNGAKGVNLLNTSGQNIFNFNIGADNYVVNNAASGNGSIGNAWSDDTVFQFRFDQISSAGGNWTITRSGGVSDLDSGTYSGSVRQFTFYAGGTDNNNPDALFVNNFAIVPEPSVSSLLLAGLLLLGGTRIFRKQNPLA